jgi:putative oxidoreductase
MQLGRLIARGVIGSLFIGHGTQKLLGSFGGPGLEGTDQMMTALEMRPARRNSLAAGVTETAGGALLVAGLATPLAAASLIGVMVTAIRKVHLPNGPWAANGGWEYNAVLIAALAVLAEDGPGDLSLDAVTGLERRGAKWALGALALGAAASTVTIELGRRAPAEPASAGTPGQPTGAGAGDAGGADGAEGQSPFPDTAGDPVTDD